MDFSSVSGIVIFSLFLLTITDFEEITGKLFKSQSSRFLLKPLVYGGNFLKRKTNKDSVKSSSVELLPQLESSIIPSASVEGYSKILPPTLLSALFTGDQKKLNGCTCTDPSPLLETVGRGCITTCLTSETLCFGQTCTRTTTFSALYSLFSADQLIGGQTFPISTVTSTQFLQFFDKECELLESQCILSSASTRAKVTGALAAGAAIALSVGIAVDKKSKSTKEEVDEEEEEYYQEIEYLDKFNRNSRSYFDNLKSSISPVDEQLDAVSRNFWDFALRRVAQPVTGTCSCSVSIPLIFYQECTTICLSSERLCGANFCTRTSIFNAFLYPIGGNNELTTQTFLAVNNKDCEKLSADCIASSAVATVAKMGALAGLAAAALSSGMGAAAKLFLASNNQSNETEKGNYYLRSSGRRAKEINYFDSLLRSKSLIDEIEPMVESSIVQEKNLKRFPRNNLFGLFVGRQEGEITTSGCTCEDPSPLAGTNARACSTTCVNSETLCSGTRTCYRSTTFMAVHSLCTGIAYQAGIVGPFEVSYSKKFYHIDETDCEILESKCNAASSLSKAIQSLGVIAALSVGLAAGAVGIALIKSKHDQSYNQSYEEYEAPQYYRNSLNRKGRQLDLDGIEKESLPSVESSIMEENKFEMPSFLKFSARRTGRAGSCTCDVLPGSECTTTCFSSEQPCGGSYCTRTSAFGACLYLGGYPPPVIETHSFLVVDNKDCDKLEIECSVASSAISAAGTAAAIGAGVGAGLSAGIAVAAVVVANNNQQNNNNDNNNNNNNDNQQSNQLADQTPANNLPFPVVGINFPDDGSGDSSVRFHDGNSFPIFSKGPCNQTNQWVTVDPISLQGGCTPRLCGDERVFVGRTGLCHHINDPLECQGGRRLYYTAYGDPICDCPIGQYPFPDSTKDDCVSLFSQGPCSDREVVSITQEGRLSCEPLKCQSINGGDDGRFQQLVPDENGICFAIGSRGTCSSTQLLGYDVFKRQLQCLVDPFSPDSSSSQQNELLDRVKDKQLFSHDYVSERMEWIEYLIGISLLQRIKLMQPIERQDTAGILQVPSSLPDSLLQPCRSGDRQGANFKCANPLVSDSSSGESLPPVPPLISCQADSFLQATGSCVEDSRAASCGPSTRFNEATGQCRSIF